MLVVTEIDSDGGDFHVESDSFSRSDEDSDEEDDLINEGSEEPFRGEGPPP